MKKVLTIALILILALSLLTACGGGKGSNSDGNNAGSGGGSGESSPSASDNSGSSDKDNTAGKPDKEKSGGTKTLDITADPGDVIFDNEYLFLSYEDSEINSTMGEFQIRWLGSSDELIFLVVDSAPFIINGSKVLDVEEKNGTYLDPKLREVKGEDLQKVRTHIKISDLEELGLSPEDIKTVQITFVIRNVFAEDLFESIVLFNIK